MMKIVFENGQRNESATNSEMRRSFLSGPQTGGFRAFFTLLIVIARLSSYAQVNNAVPEPSYRYLLPGPGISAVFNVPPDVYRESAPAFFDIAYTFSAVQHINDTATYFQSAGIYANTRNNNSDTTIVMNKGLRMMTDVMSGPGVQLLLKEQATFKGVPAWRFKYYSAPNIQMGFEGFYISIIAFVKADYFVQLVVFNKNKKGKTWTDDPFFESVAFTSPVDPDNLINKGDCSDYFQYNCNNTPVSTLFFPSGVRYNAQTAGHYHVDQYISIPPGPPDHPVLMLGMDFYTPTTTEIDADSSMLKWAELGFADDIHITILDQEAFDWNDRPAVYMTLLVDFPDTGAPDKDFVSFNLFFKHKKGVMHAYQYVAVAHKDKKEMSVCFFNWVNNHDLPTPP
jgi:hypothetical protein